jgi:hypothetical protein
MSQPTVRDLKVYLKQRTHNELVNDIVALFKQFEAVRDYYHLQFDETAAAQIVSRYKFIIKQEFFPKRGHGLARLPVARKAVTDCKKIVTSHQLIADLMLYYVEIGVEFTCTYGDIDASFYNSMESMYERAAKLISQHNLSEHFDARCQKIVRDAAGIGWGFHDELGAVYDKYFGA